MSKNTVRVYDTITKKYVEVEVTEKVRTYYNRTQWNIDDNDKSFYKHEIPVILLKTCIFLRKFTPIPCTENRKLYSGIFHFLPVNITIVNADINAFHQRFVVLGNSEIAVKIACHCTVAFCLVAVPF